MYTYIIILVLFYLLAILANEEDKTSLNYATELDDSASIVKRDMSISQYIVHDPIEINGNGDLFLQAITEGWLGDGTSTNPITIDGYNITAPTNVSCIRISQTTYHVKISNCYLSNGEQGIALHNAIDVEASDNTIFNCSATGIVIHHCMQCTASNNIIEKSCIQGFNIYGIHFCTISNNRILDSGFIGLGMGSSANCTIDENTIENSNGIGMHLHDVEDNIISNNVILGTIGGSGVTMSRSGYNQIIGNNITGNDAEGIAISRCDNVSFTDNYIANNIHSGVDFYCCFNLSVSGNVAVRNLEDGIILRHTRQSTASGNELDGNRHGLFLRYCESCIVKDNLAINNIHSGIYLEYSSDSLVDSNEAIGNENSGIGLYFCGNSTVIDNLGVNNSISGIHIDSSWNSTVTGNTAFNNGMYGIYYGAGSSENIIEENTISDNGRVDLYEQAVITIGGFIIFQFLIGFTAIIAIIVLARRIRRGRKKTEGN